MPRHEPEVEARLSPGARARARIKHGNRDDSTVRAVVKGIVAVFAVGLLLGSCVAGVMLPIRAVSWLFGG